MLTASGMSVSVGNYTIASCILVAFCFSMLIMYSWFGYVKTLVEKSNQALYKNNVVNSTWSFQNLEILKHNQNEVAEKFKVSAELISNLTNPELINSTKIESGNDPIGKALVNIRSEMLKIKIEDESRSWITQGIARFGEILRNRTDIKTYGQNIISNLVKYINASQGALFIEYQHDAGEQYLSLIGCYAYGKLKNKESRIEQGQGLVGQCMREKEFIFVNNVPDTYTKIASGLGEATPKNVIVGPLIFKDTFCGVIELATLETLQQHHIDFLKNVFENIASEIVALKHVEHAEKLLQESNTLTYELREREDQMKENLEELGATQEEMIRKQNELSGVINAIDSTLATAELDARGRIIKHNAILEQFLGLNAEQIKNKNYALIIGKLSDDVLWNNILKGNIKSGDFNTTSGSGMEIWLSITFTPITDESENVMKLLCMIQDITQKRIKEKEFEKLSLVADNTDNSVIITDRNGLIEYVNEGFIKMTGYQAIEVMGKKPGEILQGPQTNSETVKKLRAQISLGIPIHEEILNYNKKGESYWVSLAINPVKDEHGLVCRFISIQADITQTKIKALDFHQKMQALSRSNAIIELDRNGVLIDINDNYLELLGYTRDELIGKPYPILTHKENTFGKLIETVRTEGMQHGVYPRYDKSGNRHWMKLIDYPVLNMHGELEKIIEFGVDVSNEKRLEREAERRQAELKSYLHGINNTIASVEFNLNGCFTDANEIFLKVMGYQKEELIDCPFAFLMGEDPSVIMMWENLRLGKFFSGEFKMKNKIGKELWLIGTFNPITIRETPEKIMMFAQFTTLEKEKLNDLSTMVNALKLTLPVIEFNADFVCKTANEKALKIFKLSRIELRAKNIIDFIAPFYRSTWESNKDKILNENFNTFQLPFVNETHIMHYEVSVSVSRNLDGSIGKLIVILVKEVAESVTVLASI